VCEKSAATFYTRAGPEISVASTKAFLTQSVALHLLALHFAHEQKTRSPKDISDHFEAISRLPRALEQLFLKEAEIRKIAKRFKEANHMLYLGRGSLHAVALEGALKMKEISYIHAEGYAAGEMKHGPIALIDENMPVVISVLSGHGHEKTIANLEEVRTRGGCIICIHDEGNDTIHTLVEDSIALPKASPVVTPMLATVALQLLAYHVADLRGTDVDQPRNLAKSVTVE
jgi:glucosamine--fructose-6-phosphate aminotransferase (isomerizing)